MMKFKYAKHLLLGFLLSFSGADARVVYKDNMQNYPGNNWVPLGLPSDNSCTFSPVEDGTKVFTTFEYPFVPANFLTLAVAHARTLSPSLMYQGTPILQVDCDEEISAELVLRFQLSVEGNPYGICPSSQEAIQMGWGGLVLMNDSGQTVCMFAGNNAIYAFSDSVGGYPNGDGTVTRAYTSFKKIADLCPDKMYRFKVSYDNSTGIAKWFLDGNLKATSTRPIAYPAFADYSSVPNGLPNRENLIPNSASYAKQVYNNWSVLIAIDNVNDAGFTPGGPGLLDFGTPYVTPGSFSVPFSSLSANPGNYFTWPGHTASLSLFDFKLKKTSE